MEFDFKNAGLEEILKYTPELRRDAYVDTTLRMQADDNIVGIFGSAYSQAQSPVIDEALIYGHGLIPVPVAGVDAFIFKYGDYPACDIIKSTMVYLITQKCPLLYSSKMYVLDGCCPAAESAFRKCTQKNVHRYRNPAELQSVLQKVYGKPLAIDRYKEAQTAFLQLDTLLQQIESSPLSGNEFGLLAFYSRFIFNLDERIAFLTRVCELIHSPTRTIQPPMHIPTEPGTAAHYIQSDTGALYQSDYEHQKLSMRTLITVHCPDGIISKIKPASGDYFKIVQNKSNDADMACSGCIYPAHEYIAY